MSSGPYDPEDDDDLGETSGPELFAAMMKAAKSGNDEEAFACFAELVACCKGDVELSIALKD